jgi:hypothetical protein
MKDFYCAVRAYEGRPEEGRLAAVGILCFNAHKLAEATKRAKILKKDPHIKHTYANLLSASTSQDQSYWERSMRLKVSQAHPEQKGAELEFNGDSSASRFPLKRFDFQH